MEVIERIKAELGAHPVVLFMKGTPEFPMCEFSLRTARVLAATGARFHAINVLEQPQLRADVPRFSDWPSFPQLFIHGELIGGCEIVEELAASGQLQTMVSEVRLPLE